MNFKRGAKRGLKIGMLESLLALALAFTPKLLSEEPKPIQLTQSKQPKIYLTIDCGRVDMINNMNYILRNLGQDDKVTFFIEGKFLEITEGFDLACKALQLGHEIGNHSYSHPQFSKISFQEAKNEIEKTNNLLERVYEKSECGRKNPKFFRFPYGDSGGKSKKEIESLLHSFGYKIYGWTIDTRDWQHYSKTQRSLDSIMEKAREAEENDIVLVHNLPLTAEKIIPYFVSDYESKPLTER